MGEEGRGKRKCCRLRVRYNGDGRPRSQELHCCQRCCGFLACAPGRGEVVCALRAGWLGGLILLRVGHGGGARYQYPKDIWSPSGGWWPNPRSWRRNTAIAAAFILLSCIPVGLWAESHIERTPPVRKIPWRPELLTRAEVYALYDEAQAREQAKSPGK